MVSLLGNKFFYGFVFLNLLPTVAGLRRQDAKGRMLPISTQVQ